MKIKCLYRISDAGNPDKVKIGDFDKLKCLDLFCEIFGDEKIYVFGDNCSENLKNQLHQRKNKFSGLTFLNLGNSASWIHVATWAFDKFLPEDILYFVEDDYWHHTGVIDTIKLGLKVSDYFTPYDHPDKYSPTLSSRDYVKNPYVKEFSEPTQVFHLDNYIFRLTCSTTMTFACRVRTLKEDWQVWEYCTRFSKIPKDFLAFQILTKAPLHNKYYRHWFAQILFSIKRFFVNKRIVSCVIPAQASHLEVRYLPYNFNLKD